MAHRLDYKPIDSCIVFLYQLDQTHIVTVEGLGDEQTLSPIQDAMVRCHGSQCGYCTPGFVTTMHGMYEDAIAASSRNGQDGRLDESDPEDRFVGKSLSLHRIRPNHRAQRNRSQSTMFRRSIERFPPEPLIDCSDIRGERNDFDP